MNLRLVDGLVPSEMGAADQVTDPLLASQATTFECGGVALGVCISHMVADASTLCTFLNEWAAISREENEVKFIGSGFNSSSFFPARGLPPLMQGLPRSKSDNMLSKYITKKLSFNSSEISNLKEKIALNGTQQWSKVQIVSALICNALFRINRRKHDFPRDSIILQPINLRGKTASLIPKYSCGNLCGLIAMECSSTVETTEALADLLTSSIKNTIDCYSKVHLDNEEVQTMILNSLFYVFTSPPTTDVIWITSCCNFPFYEADYGFGKPVWVTCGSSPAKNTVYLIDGVGGNGVEAYVGMEDKDVPYFEEALHIKAFVT